MTFRTDRPTGLLDRRAFLRVAAGTALGGAAVLARPVAARAAVPHLRDELWLPTLWPAEATTSAVLSMSGSVGRWQAGDMPHPHALPDGRALWLLNDSYLSDDAGGPIDARCTFVRNLAMVQEGGSIHVLGDGAFLQSDGPYDRWWWFHGGAREGTSLHVVTSEMVRTGPLGWGINFEPRRTWITTVDTTSLEVVDQHPAPDDGVTPVYGFSVASDRAWTYLFGNNHLYGRGTTENRLARVPRGRLLEAPEYWDGETWTPDRSQAAVVLQHGRWAGRLHVVRRGLRWIGTLKDEEFFGREAIVYSAPQPQGPWREVMRLELATATGDDRTNTYDVRSVPLTDGRMLVWWSNNAYDESLVRSTPWVYRPRSAVVELTG